MLASNVENFSHGIKPNQKWKNILNNFCYSGNDIMYNNGLGVVGDDGDDDDKDDDDNDEDDDDGDDNEEAKQLRTRW